MVEYTIQDLERDYENGTYFLVTQQNVILSDKKIPKNSVLGLDGLHFAGCDGPLLNYLDEKSRSKIRKLQKKQPTLSGSVVIPENDFLARINSGDIVICNYWEMLSHAKQREVQLDTEYLNFFFNNMLAMDKPIAPFAPLVEKRGVYLERNGVFDPNRGVCEEAGEGRVFYPILECNPQRGGEFNFSMEIGECDITLAQLATDEADQDSGLVLKVNFSYLPSHGKDKYGRPVNVNSAGIRLLNKSGQRISEKEMEVWALQKPEHKARIHIANNSNGSLENVVISELSKWCEMTREYILIAEITAEDGKHLIIEPVSAETAHSRLVIMPGKYIQTLCR